MGGAAAFVFLTVRLRVLVVVCLCLCTCAVAFCACVCMCATAAIAWNADSTGLQPIVRVATYTSSRPSASQTLFYLKTHTPSSLPEL